MKRWNGWGDDAIELVLPAEALQFLEQRIGAGVPSVAATLEQACAAIPASRLPAHALVDTRAETRMRNSLGHSLPDWLKMRSGRVGVVTDGVVFANRSAVDAFSADREYYWDEYDFFTFRPDEILAASGPTAPPGELTNLHVYRSVWTTLYGMAWGDLSFFSVRGRISDPHPPYPPKDIPTWLTAAVLYLGLVPTLLAGIGLIVTLRRREYLPLLVVLALTMISYLEWVLAQDAWALKTKYIIFLLPVFIAYALAGLRWVGRRLPQPLTTATLVALATLVLGSHLYLLAFALGRL